MNVAETFNALARYNSWRRGDDTIEQPNSAELGATIDDAVNLLRKFANMRDERDAMRAEVSELVHDVTGENSCEVVFLRSKFDELHGKLDDLNAEVSRLKADKARMKGDA